MRYARYLSVVVFIATLAAFAQDLTVRRADDQLRVSAPRLNFLTGRPLDRLRGGSSVTYDMQLSILGDNRQVLRRGFERFVISYDLWEERFSVTRMRTIRASASHLSADAAQSWCLKHLSLPLVGLTSDRPVRVRLDVRAEDPKERKSSNDEEGMSLSRLIDIFSRAAAPGSDSHWRAESGWIDLQTLKP